MQRLSAKGTSFAKRLVPTVWFGGVAVWVVLGLVVAFGNRQWHIAMIAVGMGTVMSLGGYYIARTFLFDLVDEVLDDGNELVVRKNGQEDRIPVINIVNVNYERWINPQRITLTLREPCLFGDEVTFAPPPRSFSRRSPIPDELIKRIEDAKEAHRSADQTSSAS